MESSLNDSNCPDYRPGKEILLNEAQKGIVIATYTLIAILSMTGNAVVIFIVYHFKRMRTPTNFFIVNLAISDLLMGIMCIPFSYWPTLVLLRWPFGQFLCKAISFCKVVSVMLSAHTLIVISVDK